MESVRVWARGLFLLAVFSSTVMLLVPKSMVKQAKFVSELLLLLCVIAPLAALVGSGGAASLPSSQASMGCEDFSLGEFYSKETARRVNDLGAKTGVKVESVEVTTKDGGLALSQVAVLIGPGSTDEALIAFQEAIGIYVGIPKDKVRVVVQNP